MIVTPSTTCAPVIDIQGEELAHDVFGLPPGGVQCSMKNCFQGFHPLCADPRAVRLPSDRDMHSP